MYESEHTRFMRELLEKKPQLAEEQRKGRALLWDRQVDEEEQERFRQSRIKQSAYVYQTKV